MITLSQMPLEVIATILSAISIFLLIHTALAIYIALQASRRGYSFWSWFLAGFLSNVILFAILLAMLPDRSLIRRRQEHLELLRKGMQGSRALASNSLLQVPANRPVVEDMATFLPSQRLSAFDASLGDQATSNPSWNRSIGDEQTQCPTDGANFKRADSIGDEKTVLPQEDRDKKV